MLSKAMATEWLSTMNSFWQTEQKPESTKYISFPYRKRIYQFKVTPYGFSTSLAVLVRGL